MERGVYHSYTVVEVLEKELPQFFYKFNDEINDNLHQHVHTVFKKYYVIKKLLKSFILIKII